MNPLIGAFVLILMLSFNEIEGASGFLKKIVTKRTYFSNDKEDERAVSMLATPRRHTLKAPDNRWMENGVLEYNQEHSWKGSVDLFNQHYNKRSHPPTQSGNDALGLYKYYQHSHVPDINIPIDTKGQPERKSKAKCVDINKKACHVSAEVQASLEFVQQPFSQGPHSPLRPFQDNQPLTPEKERKDYEAYLHFHNRYGDDAPLPTKYLEGHSGGSGPGDGN